MTDRHQFRAEWHDYNGGLYFVTICVGRHQCRFGNISDNVMHKTLLGDEMEKQINAIPRHHNDVEVLNHVVMPNHVHLVIMIGTNIKAALSSSSTTSIGCLRPPRRGQPVSDSHHNSMLSRVVNGIKGGVKRFATRNSLSFNWQSRYHEHIIRSKRAFDNIMDYVNNNVKKWDDDCFYVPSDAHKR